MVGMAGASLLTLILAGTSINAIRSEMAAVEKNVLAIKTKLIQKAQRSSDLMEKLGSVVEEN